MGSQQGEPRAGPWCSEQPARLFSTTLPLGPGRRLLLHSMLALPYRRRRSHRRPLQGASLLSGPGLSPMGRRTWELCPWALLPESCELEGGGCWDPRPDSVRVEGGGGALQLAGPHGGGRGSGGCEDPMRSAWCQPASGGARASHCQLPRSRLVTLHPVTIQHGRCCQPPSRGGDRQLSPDSTPHNSVRGTWVGP